MIKSKEIFLREIALLPDMINNNISTVFALNPYIDITKKEKFFDNILPYYDRIISKTKDEIKIPEEIKDKVLDEWIGKDLRIKRIKMKTVRGYPESKKPFGISFINDDGKPQSMVILGINAIGKSSIYDAIEFCYCNKVGEAQLRTYEDISENVDKNKNFLRHFNYPFTQCYFEIDTMSSPLSIQKENIPKSVREKINPDSHFISDYDIYEKGKINYENGGEYSFHNTIAENLGLKDLLEFNKNLKSFVLYRRQSESRDIKRYESNILKEKELVNISTKSLLEKKARLNELVDSFKLIPEEISIKESIDILGKIKNNSFLLSFDLNDFNDKIFYFKDAYVQFVKRSIKTGEYSEIEFLNTGLEILKYSENCPFCNSSTKSKLQIEIFIKERIDKIQKMNESLQKLNKTYNGLFDLIIYLQRELTIIKNKIEAEKRIIINSTDFNELSKFENEYLDIIQKYLFHDYFISFSDFNNNLNFQKNKNKYLFDFLNINSEYILNDIPVLLEKLFNYQQKRNNIIIKIEEYLTKKTKEQSFTEQVTYIKKEISDLEKQIANSNDNIEEFKKNIAIILEVQSRFEKIRTETKNYQTIFYRKLNEEINKAFYSIQNTIEKILKYFLDRLNNNIELKITKEADEIDEETGEVLLEIIKAFIYEKNTNEKLIEVNRYFNTFHYRLFSMVVGLSIAIASRINTKINLPLVFDDIFYASDYENRATIEKFLKDIFDIFKEFTSELDLQMILFTHDKLIFESIINASSQNELNEISFARLFPYSSAEEKEDYLNIIFNLPVYLPQNIMTNKILRIYGT